jgi:hypothetical protein
MAKTPDNENPRVRGWLFSFENGPPPWPNYARSARSIASTASSNARRSIVPNRFPNAASASALKRGQVLAHVGTGRRNGQPKPFRLTFRGPLLESSLPFRIAHCHGPLADRIGE